MSKLGKRTREAREDVDRMKQYAVSEAIGLVKQNATAKFDETVELHLKTGLDGRHADQTVRGSVVLPHGVGKDVRVAVFAEGEAANAAIEAGADEVGSDELIERVQGGFTDFDVALAQRELMGKVGALGRVLGPRGLMPNPRNNTVLAAEDISRGVNEAKAGRVDFRLDRSNVIHVTVGKASFSQEQLTDNLSALYGEISKARPSGGKGQMIRSATLASTMGPGVQVDVATLNAEAGV